jgi:hypothetical protein
MKTNKEVVEALTKYYLEQDPILVARALASMLIDMNRIQNIKLLSKSEKENLFIRLRLNVAQLHDFIENGPADEFKLFTMNSS